MTTVAATDPSTWTDAHLHLWNSSVLEAPWMAQHSQWQGQFEYAQYREQGGVARALVLVEADVAVADRAREAQLLARAGDSSGRPYAIVAAVEPASSAFNAELAACGAQSAVRGARRVLHGSGFESVSSRFTEDLAALHAQGLSFDCCVRWGDLLSVEQCARIVPQATLVLDHLGNPPLQSVIHAPERAEWKRLIARVAACPSVHVKWSGMFENAGRRISADEARPWFEWCLACFGPARMMWGSNWPVCFSHARLSEWIEVSAQLAGELTADEQASVLSATARRVYRF